MTDAADQLGIQPYLNGTLAPPQFQRGHDGVVLRRAEQLDRRLTPTLGGNDVEAEIWHWQSHLEPYACDGRLTTALVSVRSSAFRNSPEPSSRKVEIGGVDHAPVVIVNYDGESVPRITGNDVARHVGQMVQGVTASLIIVWKDNTLPIGDGLVADKYIEVISRHAALLRNPCRRCRERMLVGK